MMYELKVKTHFDAAHKLTHYKGKCSEEHGHTWYVEVCLQSEILGSYNMLVDFKDVKGILNLLLEEYLDHHFINKTLHEEDPTAEYLTKWIFGKFSSKLFPEFWPNVKLTYVTVWESPDCCVTYSESAH